jgi:hypothetical protein
MIRSLLLVLCVAGVTTVRAEEPEAPRALSSQEAETLHADEVVGRATYLSETGVGVRFRNVCSVKNRILHLFYVFFRGGYD